MKVVDVGGNWRILSYFTIFDEEYLEDFGFNQRKVVFKKKIKGICVIQNISSANIVNFKKK